MKKCKIKAEGCHGEFKPFNSLQSCCFNVGCILKFKNTAQAKKNIKRAEREDYTSKKIVAHAKKYKGELQREINKLARMIDLKFGYTNCICCNEPMLGQIHGCHLKAVGSNSTLRYNLDNIHSGRVHCNKYSSTHESGYKLGLAKRYGDDYAKFVIEEMQLKYEEIHLTEQEVFEKLKLVRKLIRDFDTMKFEDSLQARTQLNNIIGIYNQNK